jgi:hypothetical protein
MLRSFTTPRRRTRRRSKLKDEGETIRFERTRPQTPRNKFIVHLEAGKKPVSVWTGSTNFAPSGFLGQTNFGHLVTDSVIAGVYLKLWTA